MSRGVLPAGPLAFALALAIEAPCAAQPASVSDRVATAQGLYESAAALIKAGKHAEACPKLEESQRLDPAMGTQFFLAACYESTGRPTSAWSLFLQVAGTARAAGNVQRESTARARAAVLEPKLPRIAVIVPEALAGLLGITVTRDDAPLKRVVWGAAVPVDLGQHTVRVTAPGKLPWEATVTVRQLGERFDVRVPALGDAAAPGPAPSSERAPGAPAEVAAVAAAPGLRGQRIAALVTGGVGVAGLVAGGALGILARSAWSQATAACPSQRACSADAHDASVRAVSLGTGSTVAFAAGGSAAVGALTLWLTAPSPGPRARVSLVPIAGAGAVGASISGALR